MKHSLRYCFILLALATTGLFAEAATEATPSAATGLHKTVKVAKRGHRRHRGHKRHHRRVQ